MNKEIFQPSSSVCNLRGVWIKSNVSVHMAAVKGLNEMGETHGFSASLMSW